MRMTRVIAALLLLATVLSGSLILRHRAAQADSALPACARALQLTPGTFTLVYTGLTGDESEVGLDNAAAFWAQCKVRATAALTAGHATLSARIAQVRTLFTRVQDTEDAVAAIRAGGGTLYTHTLARVAPSREQQIADIAVLTLNGLAGTPSAGYKLTISAALSDIGQRLARLEHPSKDDLQFTTRADWNSAVAEYVHAIQALERAAGTRDDAIRAVMLTFVDQPIFLN